MSDHDRATVLPLFQRPLGFWLVIIPMLLLVGALVGGAVLKERAARTVLAERALRYEVNTRAIDEAHEKSADEERARRSASMQ